MQSDQVNPSTRGPNITAETLADRINRAKSKPPKRVRIGSGASRGSKYSKAASGSRGTSNVACSPENAIQSCSSAGGASRSAGFAQKECSSLAPSPSKSPEITHRFNHLFSSRHLESSTRASSFEQRIFSDLCALTNLEVAVFVITKFHELCPRPVVANDGNETVHRTKVQ